MKKQNTKQSGLKLNPKKRPIVDKGVIGPTSKFHPTTGNGFPKSKTVLVIGSVLSPFAEFRQDAKDNRWKDDRWGRSFGTLDDAKSSLIKEGTKFRITTEDQLKHDKLHAGEFINRTGSTD